MMLQQVWNGDYDNYVSYESACNCWRKSDIFYVTGDAGMNKNIGSATLAHSKKLSVMIFLMSYAT